MPSRNARSVLAFVVIFVVIFLLHAPLLPLPYFWDEAGYYVPAARDFLLTGDLIPHSTLSNAHPPLVLAWLALWWKCAGYSPLVTRSAMLAVAAFALAGLFHLAQRATNTEVAIASALCTALYPVFFAQSSLAQVDLAAAGLTFWGLYAYLEDRPVAVATWFSLAVLAKETAILAPVALAGWELLWSALPERRKAVFQNRVIRGFESANSHVGTAALGCPVERSSTGFLRRVLPLLLPLLPLILWYAYHYARTGYVFGNPEFFRYNVAATLSPLRFLLALLLRLWQACGYLHLWLLTLGAVLAMRLPTVKDHVGTAVLGCPVERSSTAPDRHGIPIQIQVILLVVVAVYVVAMALVGGAVLARYMLPAVPLVIMLAVSSLRRRLRYWPAAVAVVGVAFIAAWFWNPPYGFSPEDNLAYRDYIVLHEDAERFLEDRYPMARVLTAWPASDELTRPWLGYTARPMQVVRIEDFSLEEVLSAADFIRNDGRQNFEVALVFSTKYEPPSRVLDHFPGRFFDRGPIGRWEKWDAWKRRFFGFHRDLPPTAVAQILGGHVVFQEKRKGQWVAVIEMEREEIQNANASAEQTD
jgi:hypothetical protein